MRYIPKPYSPGTTSQNNNEQFSQFGDSVFSWGAKEKSWGDMTDRAYRKQIVNVFKAVASSMSRTGGGSTHTALHNLAVTVGMSTRL